MSGDLTIVPLGGCGEVGLNALLVAYGQEVILVDAGALLGAEERLGVERAVPGFEPLFREGRRLAGIVLTHGHEDHVGALPALLAEVEAPVLGTPLTLALARARLEHRIAAPEARRSVESFVEVPLGGRARLGPFEIELIRVTHSLPESAAVCITTPAGRVLHSGDFKLDPHPYDGLTTDVDRLKAIGEEGVDLLLSDSTNSEVLGRARAESEVALTLDRLIAEAPGRVVVACFASHIHRVRAVVDAARRRGRTVALLGRALEDTWRIGVERGHLPRDPTLLSTPEALLRMPRGETVLITTGAQGEPRGGLARIARGTDAALRLTKGDRVVLSARTLPGREIEVRRMLNEMAAHGAELIHHPMQPVHCSGHAHQGEQAELLELVRPRHFVPIHGERAMLEAHARTARAAGLQEERVTVIEDGDSIVLGGGRVARGPREPVSRRHLDGGGRVLDWGDVRERSRLGRAGLVVCSLVRDARGLPALAPRVSGRGVSLPPHEVLDLKQKLNDLQEREAGSSDEVLEALAAKRVEQALAHGGREAPRVVVHVLRLDGRVGPW